MFRAWLEKALHLRRKWKSARKFQRRQAWSEGLSVDETFEKVYAENKWGRSNSGVPFYSGDGSVAEKSEAYEDYVVRVLGGDQSLKTWVDIGCGDFQVADRVLRRLDGKVRYIGVDVARSLIEWHRQEHARDGVSFVQCNAAASDPPAGDLVTIRQVLQHLSNEDVLRILERIKRLYRCAVITESLPVRFEAHNLDIRHGIAVRIPLGSGVYIDQPPFSLDVAEAFDSPYSEKEFIRTSLVRFDANG